MRRTGAWATGMVVLALAGGAAFAGRYEDFTAKFATGPHAKVLAATFFGGAGNEEFVAAGGLSDGGIVAFGNAFGPEFPAAPAAKVLGKGKHRGLKGVGADKNGNATLRTDNPDAGGMIVFYDKDLTRIVRVVRFDWGTASISTAVVSKDGKAMIIAGRCGPDFATLAAAAAVKKTAPKPTELAAALAPVDKKGRKPKPAPLGSTMYDDQAVSGDVYVMRLSLTGDRIEWLCTFEGLRTPAARLWEDNTGNVYTELNGVAVICAHGQEIKKFSDKGFGGHVGIRAVNAADGSYIYGGDRNTNTGFQPYRQPFLYGFDREGKKTWTMWEPNPKTCACGGSGNGLCSDSSPRSADFDKGGDMIIGGWSDGGNSVFGRQPNDLSKPAPTGGLGMASWGMRGANSLGYILRIDPATKLQKAGTMWLAYCPDDFAEAKSRGAPNFASVEDIRVLEGGAVAFRGAGATGIVQTPNAFYKYPRDGKKHGGEVGAIITGDLTHCLFSSYFPGCQELQIGSSGKRLIVVSRSTGGSDMGPSPTVNAIQKTKQGAFDAHIVLLEAP